MNQHGLSWDTDSTAEVRGNNLVGAREALRLLLSAPVRPTAVFANSDMCALLVLKAAMLYGLRVPEDLSLVGFDDLPMAELSSPGLTTVHQPIEAIGRYAATALIDGITSSMPGRARDEESGTDNVVFPPVLVCRESTCPPRR
jgi:DNA-binding LacI/PurR family transcriptional regulator